MQQIVIVDGSGMKIRSYDQDEMEIQGRIHGVTIK
ncbi:MAG: hypothetical protein IIX07_02595 [Lachnospiraceae bacterium]|nr:hypothetical protein [Lachnospiraceae bacterium]